MESWNKRQKRIMKESQKNAENWTSNSTWTWRLLVVMVIAVAIVLYFRL